jgi:hypothetical protein
VNVKKDARVINCGMQIITWFSGPSRCVAYSTSPLLFFYKDI